MDKIGEVAFPKRLYQIIDTSFSYKRDAILYFLVSILWIYVLGTVFMGFLVQTVFNFSINALFLACLIFIFLLVGIYILEMSLASILFILSPLKFKFYEQGVAINNYFVKKEYLSGYRKEKGMLLLFIETFLNTKRGSGYYETTQISMPMDKNTLKLINSLDKYGISSNYIPKYLVHQKINSNIIGQQSLFPLK
jgi:hypothetical protein